MKDQPSGNEKKISRRSILPILGSGFLIPFLGFGKNEDNETSSPQDEEYQTLLKPDGTTVKVKVSALKKSKVVKKNVSNSSFLNWLDKKL
ncbi:hypothetical protein V8G69_00410 [Gaetbulibacter sp. M235]|uniref:hypothetical protein n=1 Tax=Gaetbulibacter sp. M235 TaxID=3126510 RepID=UPI00374E89D9